MSMRKSSVVIGSLLACLWMMGCAHTSGSAGASQAWPERIEHEPLVASYSPEPLKIDGRLDETVWQKARVYTLTHVRKAGVPNAPMTEQARIRFAWTDTHLVVAGEFDDADILDSAKWNHQLHYATGDTMELFLKPADQLWYWEFYGTPRGYLTAMCYPSRNRFGVQPWPYVPDSKLRVGATYEGMLNDASQRDTGFVIEMAVPLAELEARGTPLTLQGPPWRVMVARYNWSAFSEAFQSELSTLPPIPAPNFHVYEWWGTLQLSR